MFSGGNPLFYYFDQISSVFIRSVAQGWGRGGRGGGRVWKWKADSHVQFAKIGLGHFQYLAGDFFEVDTGCSLAHAPNIFLCSYIGWFVRPS